MAAGVFLELWRTGLERYDELPGLDRSWLSRDGALTKAPLGGGKTGPNPTDRGKSGVKRRRLTEAKGVPVGLAVDGANRHDLKLVRATVDSWPVPRPVPSPETPRVCAWKGYDFNECAAPWTSLASRRTSAAVGQRLRPVRKRPASKPGAGWWNAPTAG